MSTLSARLFGSPFGDALYNTGDIVNFSLRVLRSIFTLRVFAFSGELVRQAGIVIVSSGS